MKNMSEPSEKQAENFLRELMAIQRRYANEMKNAKSNRQAEVRDLLEKIVAEGAADAN